MGGVKVELPVCVNILIYYKPYVKLVRMNNIKAVDSDVTVTVILWSLWDELLVESSRFVGHQSWPETGKKKEQLNFSEFYYKGLDMNFNVLVTFTNWLNCSSCSRCLCLCLDMNPPLTPTVAHCLSAHFGWRQKTSDTCYHFLSWFTASTLFYIWSSVFNGTLQKSAKLSWTVD